MNVSFGKFIPVRVFMPKEIEDKGKKKLVYSEVEQEPDCDIPKEVQDITLRMCDCLIKDKNYPNTPLAEQQRRFFKSKVDDYSLPVQIAENKTDILPSSVKTANIDYKRYLVTGPDITLVKQMGKDFGHTMSEIIRAKEEEHEGEGLTREQLKNVVREETRNHREAQYTHNQGLVKRDMTRSESVLDETLCIYAHQSPKYVEGKSLKRDKYVIDLIDFARFAPR